MARRITHQETVTTTNAVTTTASTPFYTGRSKILSIQSIIDVNTPAAKTFTDSNITDATDTIAIASHGFTTGLKAALTTSGALPTGLTATNYYIIVVTSGTIQLASSLANAQAGTKVVTAADGSGTHTLTPTALAGGLVGIEKSNDYDPEQNTTGTWEYVSSAVTADGSAWIKEVDPDYAYARLTFQLTAGRLSAVSYIIVKEDI